MYGLFSLAKTHSFCHSFLELVHIVYSKIHIFADIRELAALECGFNNCHGAFGMIICCTKRTWWPIRLFVIIFRTFLLSICLAPRITRLLLILLAMFHNMTQFIHRNFSHHANCVYREKEVSLTEKRNKHLLGKRKVEWTRILCWWFNVHLLWYETKERSKNKIPNVL